MNTLNASKRYRLMRAIKRLPNLVAYYPLNEVQGATTTRNYAPGNLGSFNGTIVGTTLGQAGQQGRAYSFNGTSDIVNMSTWSTNNVNFSIGAIFKSSNYTQNRQGIISNGHDGVGGYALILSGDATTDGSIYLLNHVLTWDYMQFKVQDNNRHFIIFTIDASANFTIYLDGVQKHAAVKSFGNTPAGGSHIGGDSSAAGYFKGLVQDGFFFSRALSAAEVKKLARCAGFL